MFKQIRDGDDKVEPLTKVQSFIDKHYTKLQRQRYANSQFSDFKKYIVCFFIFNAHLLEGIMSNISILPLIKVKS